MTSPDCASGTDRVAEVARKLPQAEILVNVQGDEPEMSPDNIDRVIELLEQNPSAGMATLATPMPHARAAREPGLRESRVRRRTAVRCTSAAARFRSSAIRIDQPAVQRAAAVLSAPRHLRLSPRDAAARSPRCRRRRSSRPRSSSSSACCNRAARSWSASSTTPPAASTRRPTTRRSSPGTQKRARLS